MAGAHFLPSGEDKVITIKIDQRKMSFFHCIKTYMIATDGLYYHASDLWFYWYFYTT